MVADLGPRKKYVGGVSEKRNMCVWQGGSNNFFHSAPIRISNGIALRLAVLPKIVTQWNI